MHTSPCIDQLTSALPRDVVEEIFLQYVTPFEWDGCIRGRKRRSPPGRHSPSTRLPLLLSHVSKTWRALVQNTPALWTNVCLHNPSWNPAIFQQILRYSKRSPLTACIILDGVDIEYFLDVSVKELFTQSDRIRSFRLVVGQHEGGLWDTMVPIPPMTRLEELKIKVSLPDQSITHLYPLFDSPQLHKVTWLSPHFPQPLRTIRPQMKELTITMFETYSRRAQINSMQTQLSDVFRACPNLTYLDVRKDEESFDDGPGPITPAFPLQDLRDLRAFNSGFTIRLCTAPNLRSLTFHTKDYTRRTNLLQFLSSSPQIEHLNLHLCSDQLSFDEIIAQIIPLAPSVVTLEFTFREDEAPIENINRTLEMLSRTGARAPALPKLQHLTMNATSTNVYQPNGLRFEYDEAVVLRMLESRCSPSSGREQPSLDGELAVAALSSCTMNDGEELWGASSRPHRATGKWRGAERRRLEKLREHGLVLKGNVFTPLLCQ
ncbi:hypothetical protein BJ138DRAFT_1159622 [Hygrophoropsis aurantiaca]|uniref:Uncharacterized protein n=1 Tax=Hygrophoropsis aurantiaca TaxID=72124 RepID=A0ACB8A3L4_9AGAM|nr:hypothetical protein BJ138DRAFT_1159622 [Hygrophoropsis aurantiaca]